MKVLLLGDSNSSHIQKWVVSLAEAGFTIGVFTLSDNAPPWMLKENVHIFKAPYKSRPNGGYLDKIFYLKNIFSLKNYIRKFKPDIVHAHYATSYGMLGSLSGFRPLFISVWGSDIIDFPQRSFAHKYILGRNLKNAQLVLATSHFLNNEIETLYKIKSEVIPFGIETSFFKPGIKKLFWEKETVVIGTVKSLEAVYRIDLLVDSFMELQSKYSHIKLLIVGDGSLYGYLNEKVKSLSIADKVIFTGRIAYEEIVEYHNSLDVFVNVSDYESFGVSVLEASSCEKPVVVTRTGGLTEVVADGVTGSVISCGNKAELTEKLDLLIQNAELRRNFGGAGRNYVIKNYQWETCVDSMIKMYKRFAAKPD